jgi:alkyl hydroperoxide reductase subunit AhpC
MAEILEVIMIVSFGASWPMNVIKSYKARTTRGKSLAFLLLILFGYVAGIISKLVNESYMAEIGSKWYVLFFYVLNFTMVGVDLLMYVRNYRLDKLNGGASV